MAKSVRARSQLQSRVTAILVVESDETLRTLLRRALARLCQQVLLAADAASALALFQHSEVPIDLVISEERLPGMSGTRLAENLRRRDPTIPILLVSSAFEEPSGRFPQLDKPFTIERLEQRINEILAPRTGRAVHTDLPQSAKSRARDVL